jgi:hypothetical protein
MKSKTMRSETLLNGDIVVIVRTTFSDSVSFSCYVIPTHQHSDPEIVLQNSTLEDCENALAETLENDLCDIN